MVTTERLTKLWTDWVDYWAVDFDTKAARRSSRWPPAWMSKPQNQAYGPQIDIFGNDTMTLLPITVG